MWGVVVRYRPKEYDNISCAMTSYEAEYVEGDIREAKEALERVLRRVEEKASIICRIVLINLFDDRNIVLFCDEADWEHPLCEDEEEEEE